MKKDYHKTTYRLRTVTKFKLFEHLIEPDWRAFLIENDESIIQPQFKLGTFAISAVFYRDLHPVQTAL